VRVGIHQKGGLCANMNEKHYWGCTVTWKLTITRKKLQGEKGKKVGAKSGGSRGEKIC